MTDKDLRKLGRLELVNILCRQREMIDELSAENRQLQQRVQEAEERCADYEAAQADEKTRRLESEALRSDMERILETISAMHAEAPQTEDALQAAQAEAEDIISRARAQADEMIETARRELAQQKEDFARQCEALAGGYTRLDSLFGER